MKNSSISTSVVRILLPAFFVAAHPVHALPSLATEIYAAESRQSAIDPVIGRRMGQDYPEHYAGKAYTSQCDSYNRTSLPMPSTETLQTGCMGDFNGDGCSDVAAVIYVTGDPANLRQMVTYYGSPTGFSGSHRAAFSTVSGSSGAPLLKSMDMDSDGDLDLVYMVGLSNATHELAVFYNLATGSGFFDTAVSVINPVGAGAGNPRLMDVVPIHYNLDRYADLAVADAANDRVVVYLGNSSNTFTLSPTIITEDHPNRLWTADLDRDGRDDLVTACGEYSVAGTRRLTWRRNTGLGWGNTNILDLPVTTDILHTGFAMTDVNDDGWRDIVFCRTQKSVNGNISNHDNSLWYRPAVKGNPGGYTGQIEMNGFTNGWGGTVYGLCGGDIDGDGDEDVLGAAGSSVFTHENLRVHGDSAAVVADFTGTLPSGAAKFTVADVNRDTWQDLVATSPNGHAILWYPGRPAGGFDAPVSIGTGTAVPDHPCAGDFDADGETDLVWAIPATGEIKRAFNNNGNGTSWSQATLSTLPGLTWLTADNLNNDADTDLVTVTSSGAVAWLVNSNGTSWSTDSLPALPGAAQAIIGKFASTGLKEVAIVGNAPGTLQVRDSNIFANPKWELVHSESFVNGASVGVTSGDFNRDGWIDCAWTNGTGTISWRTPGLTVSQTLAVGTVTGTVRRLRSIDWNRDGWEDILVAHTSGVTVFLSRSPNGSYNSTTGYWTPQVLFSAGACSDAIPVDIDHDGRMDVAAFDTTAGKLKLITHGPDLQARVTDEPMTTTARRANGGDSFYVLELEAENCGREDGRGSGSSGGFHDDVHVSLNRVRVRFLKAVKSGSQWIPGNSLTQAEIAASVDKVLVVRESTTQSNPALDISDTILAEATVSTSGGYMTVDFADSLSGWDDLAPESSSATYHIALKMKPTVSAATTGPFFVQHAATDAAQGTRCVNPQYWPVDTPVGTEAAERTAGQLVSLTTSVEAWRYSWFQTYTSSGIAGDNADNDRDGMPNVVEYMLFTNPTVADSRPMLSLVPAGANFSVRVDLPTQQRDDGIVALEQSSSLSGWTTLAQRTGTGVWTGAPFTTSFPGGGVTRTTFPVVKQTKRFYRLNFTLMP